MSPTSSGTVPGAFCADEALPHLPLHRRQMARHLFLTNKSRIIADCAAEPTTMLQAESLGGQPVFLGNSQLRGVAGCHAQYMANMGCVCG